MNTTVPSRERAFLLLSSIGLIPIALSYGVVPELTMELLFGISVDGTNLAHIFRAVMGLYLGMVIFWTLGAVRRTLTRPALAACAVFMLGLASGRALSFLVDGQPHWLLIIYAVLEITLGLIALYLFKSFPANAD